MKHYESNFPVKRITPENTNEHYFFGYYDVPALSPDGRYHLTNCVEQMDHLPLADEINNIKLIDLEDHSMRSLASTRSWNFQQGSMLQWYKPDLGREIIYNDYRDKQYVSVILDIETGTEKIYSKPIASVTKDGRYGLSINFNRVFDFRPGYGYINTLDPYFEIHAPEDDGVFLIDLETGESKLLFSYASLNELFPLPEGITNNKLVINHITFNPSGSRFVFLLRYFNKPGQVWKTAIGSSDLEGNVYVWRNYGMASHYFWKDDSTLLIYSDAGGTPGLYEIDDLSDASRSISPRFITQDIHCSTSPDGRFIIGDAYPKASGFRDIFLIDTHSGEESIIGSFYSPTPKIGDIRTDLHIRWSPSGEFISFDSIHEGYRGIYTMDLRSLYS